MPKHRVVLLRIQRTADAPIALHAGFRNDVITVLDPEVPVTRYTRTWRVSYLQFRGANDRYLWAKIGFVRGKGELAAVYDEETHDFLPVEGSGGQGDFSYFVVDRSTQYMAVEIKPEIRPTAIAGALNKMFDEQPEMLFEAVVVADTAEFESWLKGISRLERVAVKARRPNFSWDSRSDHVRELVEETHAAHVSIEVVAPKGESLVVEGTDLKEFVDYAGRGYGSVTAVGREGETRVDFSSDKTLRSAEITTTGDETEQSVIQKIINALGSLLP